jgi:hypothetical protein
VPGAAASTTLRMPGVMLIRRSAGGCCIVTTWTIFPMPFRQLPGDREVLSPSPANQRSELFRFRSPPRHPDRSQQVRIRRPRSAARSQASGFPWRPRRTLRRLFAAAKAPGDDGSHRKYIVTLPGRGYRFVPESLWQRFDFDPRGSDGTCIRNEKPSVGIQDVHLKDSSELIPVGAQPELRANL